MTAPVIAWTDERVDLLTRLWLEGRSANQIAAELGGDVTRNAVIGKVHRLGLSGRKRAVAAPAPRSITPAAAVPRAASSPTKPAPAPAASAALRAPSVAAPVLAADPVTIMGLRDSMCRWPLGDPGSETFRYCGSRAVPNSAGAFIYCEEHLRLAYQPSAFRARAPHPSRITAAA